MIDNTQRNNKEHNQCYEQAVEVPLTLEYNGGSKWSTPVLEDFQESPDDEEDSRSSQEYMNDLDEEYQARALLAKSKRQKKGLITESYSWDEEEVSSDGNDATEVKALMALADEERVSIFKESDRNGEWIKISMKKVPSNESQRNTTDHSAVVSDSSATNYDSADESSVCVTINEPSSAPARGNKSSSVFKTNSAPAGKLKNVKIEDDPPLAIVMKELNELKLQISKNKSSYFKNKKSQQVPLNAL
ncbi:hypothetical protein Tco_0445539 [Tanacetum coccineum]